jgi:sugar (pentulose or hexulose) kinase
VLNLPSYLVKELCGEAWVDDNLAAMSGLYSLRDRTWWPDALAYAGVHTEQLPRLCPVGSAPAVTGAGARVYGLPAGVPVVTAGNDQTAGAVGAAIDQHGAALITLGTAMAVYACSEDMPIAHASLVRGPYPGGGAYRMATAPGGSCVNWAASRIDACADEEAFFRMAANGSDEVVFTVTGPAGEGAWEPPDADGPSRARAVVQALAHRMRDMVGVVDPAQELPVCVAGGGTRSALWLTLLEQALDRQLSVVDADPLRGAARMAARLRR